MSDEARRVDAGTIEALNQQWELYRAHTARVDQIARQLAFAGIALVWIFHKETSEGLALDRQLVLAAYFFALTLITDLLQELSSAIIADRIRDFLIHHTRYTGWRLRGFQYLTRGNPTRVLFLLKVGLLFTGYVAVIRYLGRVIHVT